MIQNIRFALVFRIGSFLFATAGLLAQIGVFGGTVHFGSFMFYTIQSNLIAVILFALLSIRTAKAVRAGESGNVGWYPRLVMVLSANLLVTLIVFWVLLVPYGGIPAEYLWSFENIAVHTVTPLLCLLDYILFSEAQRLKYRDVYYVCLFPVGYVIFATIAGLAGYVYYYSGILSDPFSSHIESVPVRFPYFFLDFDRIGLMALVYIGGILLFFLLLSHGIFFLDRKVRKQPRP